MKLKDKKGLTLVEMLCTVAILVLVSMVMVLGVQLGGKDILPAKAYPYGIKAEVGSLTYDDVTALFTVQLSVKDSENKNTLAETTFEVEKLNVMTEDTAEGRARAEDIRNTEN